MAFNVTQCPVCESTFNTNARMLESAVGRVRCGACLAVFDAARNYIEEADNDSAYHGEESVFVGNNPEEFFDPSLFLTRSALTASDEAAVPSEMESSDNEAPIAEDLFSNFEQAETGDSTIAIGEGLDKENAEEQVKQEPFAGISSDYESLIETAAGQEAPRDDDSMKADPELAVVDAEEFKQEDQDQAWEFQQGPPAAEPENENTTAQEDANASDIENPDQSPAIEPAETETVEPLEAENDSETELDVATESENDAEPEMDANIEAGIQLEAIENEEQLKSPVLDWSALDDEPSPIESIEEEAAETRFILESDPEEAQEEEADTESEPHLAAVDEEAIAEQELVEIQQEQAEESTDVIRARALEAELEDEDALEAIPQENLAVLGEMSTPLELQRAGNSRWGQRIALSCIVLLLGGLLAAQYLWRSMEVYSQRAQLRPFLEFSCNWLNCELPPYSDIAAIRSDNLSVRSHPELANGLMVNTTIRNTAAFPQAFPIMVLSFNSTSNNIIALREFAPQEYLEPALQSFSSMPVMTPVQIDLEIIDPGPDAVNYTLAFRLP